MLRRCADCPTSVLNMSAKLDPSQSSPASPEPLRNGKIASDTSDPAAALVAVLDVNLPLTAHPPMATATARPPTANHFQGTSRLEVGVGITREAAIGRFPSQASRSAKIS